MTAIDQDSNRFDPPNQAMGRSVKRGAVATGGAQIVKLACQIVSVIVLSRLLQPADFGIVAMAAPITKGAWRVERPEDVPALLDRAFALALEGRPGPVLVDIPMDVQRAEIEAPAPSLPRPREPGPVDPGDVAEVLYRLATAERPPFRWRRKTVIRWNMP